MPNNEVEYKAPMGQMKFLQLLSSGARQNFTYHCKDSFALKDYKGQQIGSPLKIKLDNEDVETLSVEEGSRKLTYEVSDGCSNDKHGSFRKTVIDFSTKNTSQLPIIDIAAHDIG